MMKTMKLVLFFLLCLELSATLAVASEKKVAQKPSPENQWATSPHYLFYISPLLFYIRYEKSEDQAAVRRDPQLLGFGVDYSSLEVSFEASRFNTQTSSGNLVISREVTDYLFWARYRSWSYQRISVIAAAALGTYDEMIENRLANSTSVTKSQWNWATGLSGGLRFDLHERLLTSFEIRALFGKDYDPQPQIGFLLRIGFRY